jgi:hypothetical protein
MLKAALAATVVAGTLTAPALAHADDCISGRIAWASTPDPGTTRNVFAKLVDVLDAENWVGYADVELSYVPAKRVGNFFFPAHLAGSSSELFSDRTFCRDNGGGFCSGNPFDQQNTDSFSVSIGGDLLGTANSLGYHNATWNYNKNASTYTCVNSNTVAYNVGDRTMVFSLKNVQTIIPR